MMKKSENKRKKLALINDNQILHSGKRWPDVWNVINNFDIKHMKSNYPYQQREIEYIVSLVEAALKATNHVPRTMELNFVQIENLLGEIVNDSKTPSNMTDIKINILKDEIHQICIKFQGTTDGGKTEESIAS